MKNINKRDIKFTAIAAILITIFTIGIVNAAETDISKVESRGKNAINDVFSLGYNSIANKTNTYCIQHHKSLRGEPKEYVVDKYVEIDGKTATVYQSARDSGVKVNSDYNAIVTYIFNKNQGYGTADNNTEAQKALWYFANNWVNDLFGQGNDYVWSKNDNVSIVGNNIVNEAIEYSKNVGNVTSSADKKLEMIDKTPNKDMLKKLDLGNGYYRIGPFSWEFEGTLKSINVKADGKQVTDVKFVIYEGQDPKKLEVKDIESGKEFYIDIKDAQNITSVHLNLKTNKKITVQTVKAWFFKSGSKYQNLVHAVPGKGEKDIEGEENLDYGVQPHTIKVGLQKVDDRDVKKPLENVGFIFRAKVQTYDLVGTINHGTWTENVYDWKTHIMYVDKNNKWSEIGKEEAQEFKTNKNGIIGEIEISFNKTYVTNRYENDKGTYISAKYTDEPEITAIETSNPHYGYEEEIGKEYLVSSVNETKVFKNHQKYIKLSGFVWLDEHQGKTNQRDDSYNSEIENGINGIKVYLKDANGNIIKDTNTSELGLYDEIDGGEYQIEGVNLDELQAGKYHIEFEYGGIKYQSVEPKLKENGGSKAVDTNSRNILDSKFTTVDGNGTQNLDINGVKVNYNAVKDHVSTVNSYENDNVYASTDETKYDLYSNFAPTQGEIRYINLGLFKKEETDYAIKTELHNVRVTVNGSSHIYKYGSEKDVSETSWNVGVKFQGNNGNYSRAIYNSDLAYTSEDKDKELKVYATYIIGMKNQSSYLCRINNIVDYCDGGNISSIKVGNTIDENYVNSNDIHSELIGENIGNNRYSKYKIDTNAVIEPGREKIIYVEFELNRGAVLSLINDGRMLNHITEINSYTTFKNNNINTPLSVVDGKSVPGNAVPGDINTYENDTDGARSLKLELRGARAVSGIVFEDSSEVTKTNERRGNGKFDDGEKILKNVAVKLINADTNEIAQVFNVEENKFVNAEITTDENGNFKIAGFIPGNYKLVYIWGDKEYQVQWYKATIYDKNRNQNDEYWYKTDVDVRYTDALDNHDTRRLIDEEMRKVTTNTLEKQISDAYEDGYNPEGKNITITKMDATTPLMKIDLEYDTTITNGLEEKVEFEIQNVDFGIVERPKQALELTKRISGYKITLANGQVLVDAKIDENGNLTGTHENTTYLKPSVTESGLINIGQLKTEIDNELIEGATLDTIYAMTVKNVGELDYSDENYYDYGIIQDKNKNRVTVSVAEILDYVDGRLNNVTPDGYWEEKNEEYLKQVNASKKNATDINQYRNYTTNKLVKSLVPGDTTDVINLYTSKLLTSTDDNTFNNEAEITQVTKEDKFTSGTPVKLIENHFAIGDSEEIIIIPSTGENKNYILPIVIGITAITILGAGIILIKRFIINK